MNKTALSYTLFFVLMVFAVTFNAYDSNVTGSLTYDNNLRDVSYIKEHLTELRFGYNDNLDKIPNYVKTIFGDARVNVLIVMSDGTHEKFGFVTENAEMTLLKAEWIEDATLVITTTEQTLKNIYDSENQLATFKNALDEGFVEYSANTFGMKAKMWVSGVVLKVVSIFRD